MSPCHSTLLYITLLWLYFTLGYSIHYSTMALLQSTLVYTTLPLLYFSLLHSTLHYHGSTSLYFTLLYSTMAIFHSTFLYIDLPWLYFTLPNSTLHCLTLHYPTMVLLHYIHDSTLLYHGSTSLYITLHYSTMALLHSVLLYISLPWLHFTLPCFYYGNVESSRVK